MKLTPEMQLRIGMMFDSYIKKSCKNELFNIQEHRKLMKEKELLVADIVSVRIDTEKTGLTVPDFIIKGHEIAISNRFLLVALEQLEPSERELILLLFYMGYKPIDLSTDLGVGERTVYNRKNRVLKKLKKIMEE